MRKDWKTRGEVLAAILQLEKNNSVSYYEEDACLRKDFRTRSIWRLVRRKRESGDPNEGKGACYRVIRKMVREGLLERDGNRYSLSPGGRRKAEEEMALLVLADG